MLVGLPYGFNDAHYGETLTEIVKESPYLILRLSLNGAILAGKVIDRNMSPHKLSFAHAMNIEEQMASVALSTSDSWWKLPNEPGAYEYTDIDFLRERLLLQFYFFHIKLYVHLPFIGQLPIEATHQLSKTKCEEASKELLRRYIIFRSENLGPCLFECKTTDFIAFTAVVVLLICASKESDRSNRSGFRGDISNLVAATGNIFEKLEEKGCKVVSQCRATIQFLSSGDRTSAAQAHTQQVSSIKIPYFGTVVKQSLAGSLITPSNSETLPLPTDYFSIEYQRLEDPVLSCDDSYWGGGNTSGGESFPWAETEELDIGQDWAVFQDYTL